MPLTFIPGGTRLPNALHQWLCFKWEWIFLLQVENYNRILYWQNSQWPKGRQLDCHLSSIALPQRVHCTRQLGPDWGPIGPERARGLTPSWSSKPTALGMRYQKLITRMHSWYKFDSPIPPTSFLGFIQHYPLPWPLFSLTLTNLIFLM